MGQYITYITGVATILAFIIQVRDVFPAHREARKGLLILVTGFFIGSILGSINSVDIKIATELHPIALLLLAFLAIIIIGLVILSVISVTTSDLQRRNELYNFIGGGIIVFFLVLGAAGFTFGVSGLSIQDKSLSNKELVSLTAFHLEHKDYENALIYLQKLQYRYRAEDPRRNGIETQMIKIKQQMAESIIHDINK